MKLRRIYLVSLVFSWLLVYCWGIIHAEGVDINKATIQWTGFGQFQFDSIQEKPETWHVRRVRVGLKVDTPAGFKMKIQLDPTLSTALLDLKLSLTLAPEAVFHLGQFKIPFSRESLTSSSRLELINLSRPVGLLVPGRDNKAKGRDIGLAFQGKMSSFEYQVGLFNGAGINCKDDNSQKDLAARLVWHPAKNTGLGYSYYRGTPNLGTDVAAEKKIRNDVEFWWQTERFLVQAEWLWGTMGEVKSSGAYLLGSYDLIPEKIRLLTRWEKVDLDKSRQADDFQVITFGLTWFFPGKSKLQINYEIHREEEVEVKNNAFLVQLQVGF